MFRLSFDQEIAQSVDVITEACRQLTPDSASLGHDGIILSVHDVINSSGVHA